MPYLGTKGLKASDIRRFNVTGSTSATHTLTWVAPTEQSLIVTINGVKQQEDAYSVSGTTLTLTSALVATDKMEVVGINDVGTTVTPAQNSVNLDKLATTGTPSSSTFLRGDMAWTAVSDTSGMSSVQTFTSSGTWTKPSGITKVVVFVTGAGASGRSVSGNFGGGGGGGTAIKFLDVSSISSSTITIGTGGAATANGGNSSWADGTNTITGNGGSAPISSPVDGGSGGSATGGDINHPGGNGSYYSSGLGGGSSYWGTYGHSNGYNGSVYTIGSAPNIPGNGGMGWYSSLTPTSGSNGFVYVMEYK